MDPNKPTVHKASMTGSKCVTPNGSASRSADTEIVDESGETKTLEESAECRIVDGPAMVVKKPQSETTAPIETNETSRSDTSKKRASVEPKKVKKYEETAKLKSDELAKLKHADDWEEKKAFSLKPAPPAFHGKSLPEASSYKSGPNTSEKSSSAKAMMVTSESMKPLAKMKYIGGPKDAIKGFPDEKKQHPSNSPAAFVGPDGIYLQEGDSEAGPFSRPGAFHVAGIVRSVSSDSDLESDETMSEIGDEHVIEVVRLQAETFQDERSSELMQLKERVQENDKKLSGGEKSQPPGGPRRLILALSCAAAFVVLLVAVVCGVTLSKKKNEANQSPTLSPERPVDAPENATSQPDALPPSTLAPTSPFKCFENKDELVGAVNVYLANNSAHTNVSARYGWPIGTWCVSKINDFASLFDGTSNPKVASFDESLADWDTSQAYNFESMFLGASAFNQDLSKWDMSNANDVIFMFKDAVLFNGNISTWNLTKVDNFYFMFSGATAFNSDISGWDVTNIVAMDNMFSLASAFNQDLSSWNVGGVKKMQSMFEGTVRFNRNLSAWDVSNVGNMEKMFKDSAFNQDISRWNLSSLQYASFMFQNNQGFDQDISDWDTRQIISTFSMFKTASAFSQNISAWDVSRVANFKSMFAEASKFNQDLSSWNVAASTDFTEMFYKATSFNQSLCAWGLLIQSNASFNRMFADTSCSNESDAILAASPPGPFCTPCTG